VYNCLPRPVHTALDLGLLFDACAPAWLLCYLPAGLLPTVHHSGAVACACMHVGQGQALAPATTGCTWTHCRGNDDVGLQKPHWQFMTSPLSLCLAQVTDQVGRIKGFNQRVMLKDTPF
jgi:hypothetical protein